MTTAALTRRSFLSESAAVIAAMTIGGEALGFETVGIPPPRTVLPHFHVVLDFPRDRLYPELEEHIRRLAIAWAARQYPEGCTLTWECAA